MQATKAAKITVKLDRKVLYEVDGGDRAEIKAFKIRVHPPRSRSVNPQRWPGSIAMT